MRASYLKIIYYNLIRWVFLELRNASWLLKYFTRIDRVKGFFFLIIYFFSIVIFPVYAQKERE